MTKKITALLFHRITKSKTNIWEDVQEEKFKHILELIGNQWLVSPDDKPVHNENWIVTFDDGLESDYNIVYPLLLKKKIKAIFFIIANRIGKPNYLNWDQILEMTKNGLIFGSHGKSHKIMTELSIKEAKDELLCSKNILEEKLNKNIRSFSFPYGYWNKELIITAKEVGYDYIYTSQYGIVSKENNSYLPRNCINSSMNIKDIKKAMKPANCYIFKRHILQVILILIKTLIGKTNYIKLRNLIFKK